MKKTSLILLTVLMSAMLTFAQTTGRLVGTVLAPDGALIPGASVVVTDNQTGRQRTVVATNEGTFDVPQLEFGTYTVTITASGYKTFTAPDVKIDAGREHSLRAQLEIGEISETVTVTAGAEQINASNAELSTTVSPQQIRELPLNGRNPLSLISLQAGASATSGSINGQRTSTTNVTRDGLVVQDVFIRSGRFVADQPTVDDTGEFTLVTQNAGAELGGGSTQVQLVTPRGGSQFRGSLFAFNRNSEFTASRFFSNLNNLEKPFLNRNQFGGSISGPAPIFRFGEGGPAIVRNKAFFFFNYEGFRLAQQVSASGTTLLPDAQQGNFTYIDNAGVQRTVNVLTGAGFTAPIPASQGGVLSVSPVIQSRILSQLPTNCTGNQTGINFTRVCNFNRADPEERNSYAARFDVDISNRNTVNFVYKRNNIQDARTDIAAGFSPNVFVNQGGPTNFFVGAWRFTPTGRFSNEVRAGFNYSEPFFSGIGNLPQDYLISNLQIISQPEASFFDQGRNTLYKTIQNNAVYTTGNHSIRFGGQLEQYRVEAVNFAGVVPTFNILGSAGNVVAPRLDLSLFPGGINATDRGRADALRFLLAGIIGGGSVNANLVDTVSGFQLGAPAVRILNYDQWSGYISDQWRVRPNLTLNMGLRYELYTPLNDPRGLYLEPVVTNFSDPVQDLLNPNGIYNFVGTNAGKIGDFHKADKNNFAPNISFAYTPRFETGLFSRVLGGGTVIRGGFRVSYNNDEYIRSSDNAMLNNQGLGTTTVTARSDAGLTTLRSSVSPVAGFDPLPGFVAPTMRTIPFSYADNNTAAFGNFGVVSLLDPNLQVPRSYEYNLGIQRNVGFRSVVEIRYVGNRSNQLIRSIDYNQVNIRDTGFLDDFIRAQQNCRLQGATIAGTGDPLFRCTSAAFNPNIAGSQQLPVFNQLASGGLLTNATILSLIRAGTPGDLATTYVTNRLQGNVAFLANPNTGVANFTTNGGTQNYNSLQVELRRRFHRGFAFQANYAFSKTLADIVDDTQTRVNPYLDNLNPRLDYGRPDYDRTHVFNFNSVYELPFGRGKRFLNQGGFVNALFGGFQISTILQMSSGAPIGVLDPRGTLNRAARSGRQSAWSNLSHDELKNLFGVYKTPNGVFYIDPRVLFATGSNGQRVDLTQPLPAGVTIINIRGAAPIDQTPFAEQVFFFNQPGQTGNLGRNFANGPKYINLNLNLSKSIRFTETMRLQIRGELFNALNRPNFVYGDFDITSNNFGRITGTYDPRVVQFGVRFDF
jgi:hypothetical protein